MEHTDLELYIQIRDGHPVEHPIFADNFKLAFPDVNINELPADRFAKFIRVEPPQLGTFEVYEGVMYEWAGDVVKDVHYVRQMGEEERADAIARVDTWVAEGKAHRITVISSMLEKETNENAQEVWGACLTAHENWMLESYDPITPFPRFPIKDEAGNWGAP